MIYSESHLALPGLLITTLVTITALQLSCLSTSPDDEIPLLKSEHLGVFIYRKLYWGSLPRLELDCCEKFPPAAAAIYDIQ